MLTVEKPKNKQRNCDNSMYSIDSGRSSVKQKSVANSSYQKRRLSCDSLKNGGMNEEIGVIRGDQIVDYEAECFFVDDVPVRVELKESTDCLTAAKTKAARGSVEDGSEAGDVGQDEQGRQMMEQAQFNVYTKRGEGDSSSVVSLYNDKAAVAAGNKRVLHEQQPQQNQHH